MFEGVDGVAGDLGVDAAEDGFVVARRDDPVHQEFGQKPSQVAKFSV